MPLIRIIKGNDKTEVRDCTEVGCMNISECEHVCVGFKPTDRIMWEEYKASDEELAEMDEQDMYWDAYIEEKEATDRYENDYQK